MNVFEYIRCFCSFSLKVFMVGTQRLSSGPCDLCSFWNSNAWGGIHQPTRFLQHRGSIRVYCSSLACGCCSMAPCWFGCNTLSQEEKVNLPLLDAGVQERAVGRFPIMVVKNSRISFGNSFTAKCSNFRRTVSMSVLPVGISEKLLFFGVFLNIFPATLRPSTRHNFHISCFI
jgi:hypothetical protein